MNYLFLIVTLAIVVAILCIAAFGKFKLTNEGYDRLKAVVIKWSYLVVFIGLIVKTFDIPYGVETVTIVAGIGAMFAGLLGISNVNFTGEKITEMYNADLLKDMLGFDEDMNLLGQKESEEEVEEEVEEDEEESEA